jgi:hypothetical protein
VADSQSLEGCDYSRPGCHQYLFRGKAIHGWRTVVAVALQVSRYGLGSFISLLLLTSSTVGQTPERHSGRVSQKHIPNWDFALLEVCCVKSARAAGWFTQSPNFPTGISICAACAGGKSWRGRVATVRSTISWGRLRREGSVNR